MRSLDSYERTLEAKTLIWIRSVNQKMYSGKFQAVASCSQSGGIEKTKSGM